MIWICVLTLNRPGALQELLRSTAEARRRTSALTLILHQQSNMEGMYKDVLMRHFHTRRNMGCAGGRKFLVERARAMGARAEDMIVFLDDDIVATSDKWLDQLCAPLAQRKAHIAGKEAMRVTPDYLTVPAGVFAADYVSGGWCVMRAAIFYAGCQFDTQFNPNYWEDADLCFQARSKGFAIVKADADLRHDHTGQGNAELFLSGREKFRAKWQGVNVG